MKNISIAIFVYDLEKRLVYMNQSAEKLTGFSLDINNKTRFSEWFATREELFNDINNLREKLLQSEKFHIDAKLRIKFGDPKKIYARVEPYFSGGKFSGFIIVIDEALKEIAVRAHQQAVITKFGLIALSGIPLDELMEKATIFLAKTLKVEFTKVLELHPEENYFLLRAGVGWKPGLVGTARIETEKHSQAGYTLLSSEPVVVFDLPNEKRFQGPPLLIDHGVRSGMSVIISLHDKIFGVLGAHTRNLRKFSKNDVNFLQALANVLGETIDHNLMVTSLKKSEEKYRALNEELERRVQERTAQLEITNRELESFSYSISHDLRAPVRRIRGFIVALSEDCGDQLDALGRDYLERILKSVDQMSQLINALLSLSHLTRKEIIHEEVNLSRIARETIGFLKKSEPTRNVDFFVRDGMVVAGDSHLLQIVIENLIENAWKFTEKEETGKITFDFEVSEDNGKRVFYVQDNGVGFDEKYKEKLFKVFQRLHSPEEFEGIGIGLASVKRIVNKHGGQIWATGELNKGATFYFTLDSKKAIEK
ncbi:MAG: ATP-binding protein [Promethearchaeota archaeon]